MPAEAVVNAVRTRDAAQLRNAVKGFPKDARHPRSIIEAARLGWKDGIKALLAVGADPNASFRNYRPLHALIQEDPHAEGSAPTDARIQCLQYLLANEADPELPGAWPPARATMIAAFVGEPRYVEILIKNGAEKNGFVSSALGDVDAVGAELRRSAKFATARDGRLLTALQCCSGSRLGKSNPVIAADLIRIAQRLLAKGAEVNALTRSWDHDVDAIYFASSSSNRDLYVLLLEHGASAQNGLRSSVWRCNFDFASLAIQHGAKIDETFDGEKPLLNQLIRWGQFKPAFWLMERGACPNIPDARGWTAAHQAASRGNERILAALIEAGADLTRKDEDGRTPGDIACEMKRSNILELLSAAH